MHGRARLSALAIKISSFGFKYGAAPEADLVIDLRRRLANPRNHLPRGAVGTDNIVRKTVLGNDGNMRVFTSCQQRAKRLIDKQPSASIAFGCKSGIHRSVVFAEELAARLRRTGHEVEVEHLHLRS